MNCGLYIHASSDIPENLKAYISSTTSADAPPPPLQTPPTPYLPFFCLSTCKWRIYIRTNEKKTILRYGRGHGKESTPKSVTKIRAPLQPRGCPRDTAPPCTLTLSCKQKIKLSISFIQGHIPKLVQHISTGTGTKAILLLFSFSF